MNINRELKVIWWAPERCATKISAEIFKKFDFEVYENTKKTFKPLSDNYHSHEVGFPEEFTDYRVICNVRNPYDRVLSFYLNFTSVGRNFVYLKNKKDDMRKKIEFFCTELFEYAINRQFVFAVGNNPPVKSYVKKFTLDGKLPDQLIRMENLQEDFEKIDFIYESKFWKSGEIQEMIHKNNFINKKPFHFSDLFNQNSASRVFNYYKKHFYFCGYDPFSFTNENLTNQEKIDFIHRIL